MKKQINYKKIFARKFQNEEKIRKFCPDIKPKSGIYWFGREDENGIKYGYIGKSETDICSRMSDHFSGFQHIDLSIKKWGMYDEINNPHGYKCGVVCYCSPEECDEKEQYYIKLWANNGIQLRNVQSGGSLGRTNISENKPAKGYYDGVAYGELRTKRKVKEFFDKYLDFNIKEPSNKIKERKLAEFGEFLEIKEEGGE